MKQTKPTKQNNRQKEIDKMIREQNELYEELTDTFDEQRQFDLLNKLIDIEIMLEKECNI